MSLLPAPTIARHDHREEAEPLLELGRPIRAASSNPSVNPSEHLDRNPPPVSVTRQPVPRPAFRPHFPVPWSSAQPRQRTGTPLGVGAGHVGQHQLSPSLRSRRARRTSICCSALHTRPSITASGSSWTAPCTPSSSPTCRTDRLPRAGQLQAAIRRPCRRSSPGAGPAHVRAPGPAAEASRIAYADNDTASTCPSLRTASISITSPPGPRDPLGAKASAPRSPQAAARSQFTTVSWRTHRASPDQSSTPGPNWACVHSDDELIASPHA